jgi:putative transposase
MCHALKVTPSGYYKWLKAPPGKRKMGNMKLLERIREIHEESDQTYGSPRITSVLLDEGFKVSRPRVARMMRKHGIRAKTVRKFRVTTDSDHSYPVAPNLLNQDFTARFFGEVWASDITYIRTGEGWLYLTVIMDLYNREIVGWSMSESLRASRITLPAFRDAVHRFPPGTRPDLPF